MFKYIKAYFDAKFLQLFDINTGFLKKIPSSDFSAFLSGINDNAFHTVYGNPGNGVQNCITQILVTNASETVGTKVLIYSDKGEIYEGFASKSGGGFSISFQSYNPLLFGDNSIIRVKCITAGADVSISINGFIAKV